MQTHCVTTVVEFRSRIEGQVLFVGSQEECYAKVSRIVGMLIEVRSEEKPLRSMFQVYATKGREAEVGEIWMLPKKCYEVEMS